MHDTIKQLQEENEKKHFDILALESEGNGLERRIAELEKELSLYKEITENFVEIVANMRDAK